MSGSGGCCSTWFRNGPASSTMPAPPRAWRRSRPGWTTPNFAWSGAAAHEPGRNGAAYFGVHGPRLVIEFAPQEPGGDLTMHVHTIYRDPAGDYGRVLLAQPTWPTRRSCCRRVG